MPTYVAATIDGLLRLWRTPAVNPDALACRATQPSETPMSDDKITSLADHQRKCGERADVIIGLALQLKAAIRSAPVNLPLPDAELDRLQGALTDFVIAARRIER